MGLNPSQLTDAMRRCIPEKIRKEMGKHGLTFEEALATRECRRERDLQLLLRQLLDYHDIPYVNGRTDKKSTCAKGTPDFVLCIRGKTFAWECKTEEGRFSDDQLKMIARWKRNGAEVFVVTSVSQALVILREAGCP